MLVVVIVVTVTKEIKSTEADSRDRSSTVKKVVSGAVRAMTVSALLSWVKEAYSFITENLL